MPGLDFSSPPPISSPVVLPPLSPFSQCNSSFSESCSNISVSGQEGVPLPSNPSGKVGLHLISQMCTFDFKFLASSSECQYSDGECCNTTKKTMYSLPVLKRLESFAGHSLTEHHL